MAARLPRRTYFWILPSPSSVTHHERHRMWRLEVRKAVARELSEFFRRCRGAGLQDHERVWSFAPFLVWQAYNGGLLDRRMAQQHAFDFYRRDVLTTADDHVLDAIAYLGVTIGWRRPLPSPEGTSRRAWLSRGSGSL